MSVFSLPRRLRERSGVRTASALAAAAAVAVVLVVAGISLVLILDQTLTSNTRASLQQNAEQLGTRIGANFSGGDAKENAIDATGKRTDIVQVVTAYSDETNAPDWMVGSNGSQGDVQIIGSSDPLDQQGRIVPWLLAPGEIRSEIDVPITFGNGRDRDGANVTTTQKMMVVGLGYRVQGRPITIYAAQELGPAHQAVETVTWLVAGGVPILVLVAGFFTYLFSGRALRPVEEMRVRVAGMGEKDLSQRVPEPVARDEVGRLARTMNQMLGRIESSQTTQRRFVADASHELRSPLATVSTGLELLGAGMAKGSPDRATVDTLRGETSRLTGLVEGLLFLARADERGVAPRREEVDLDEIADAERVRPSAEAAVAVRITSEPIRVVGDRGQLVRVVRNLVDNAKRHASSTVAVSVRAEDESAVIDVDDDGNGVPEADRARIFERFVRLDEARSRGDGGSGLGLSIVSELVAGHGGTVEALESDELGGARFRVRIPVATGSLPEPDDSDRDEPDGATEPVAEESEGAPGRGSDAGGVMIRALGEPGVTRGRGTNGHRPGGAPVTSPETPDPEDDVPAPQPYDRRDPPTGPLPIRPDTVGSPADENATGPIPVQKRAEQAAERHRAAVATGGDAERARAFGDGPTRPVPTGARPPMPRRFDARR